MSIRDITLGQYVHADSPIHRLDSRSKLACMIILTVTLFSGGWETLVGHAVFTGMAMYAAKLKPGYLIRGLRPFIWLVIFTVLMNVLFVGGHIIIEAPLPYGGITSEGLSAGTLYGGRIIVLITLASLLTLTTEPVTLVSGIEKALRPFGRFGVNARDIALSMVITIRFIPVLMEEAVRIRKSFLARGFNPKRGVTARFRSVSMMLMPLFTSAVRRADELALAMDCRLYRSGATHTRYGDISLEIRDGLAVTVTLVWSIILMWSGQ